MTISVQTDEITEITLTQEDFLDKFEQFVVETDEWMGSSRTIRNLVAAYLKTIED